MTTNQTNRPNIKSSHNHNPATKQQTVVSNQLNMVVCHTYSETVKRGYTAPLLLPSCSSSVRVHYQSDRPHFGALFESSLSVLEQEEPEAVDDKGCDWFGVDRWRGGSSAGRVCNDGGRGRDLLGVLRVGNADDEVDIHVLELLVFLRVSADHLRPFRKSEMAVAAIWDIGDTVEFLRWHLLIIFVYCYGRMVIVMRRQMRVMAGHNVEGSSQNASKAQSQRVKWNIIKTKFHGHDRYSQAQFVSCWVN